MRICTYCWNGKEQTRERGACGRLFFVAGNYRHGHGQAATAEGLRSQTSRKVRRKRPAAYKLIDQFVHVGKLSAAFREASLRDDGALVLEVGDGAVDRLHAAANLVRKTGLRASVPRMRLQILDDAPLRGR